MAEKLNLKNLNEKIKEGFEQMENSFNVINKNNDKIYQDLNEMKNEIIKNLIDSNKKLQKKVEKLENQIKKQEETIEINNQYTRRNNLEIHGISEDIQDEELEEKVVEILKSVDIKVNKENIEACHRLPKRRRESCKRTIIRFVNRKTVEESIKSKSKLKNVNRQIFFAENLNKYFQKIAWLCRKLKKESIIDSFKFQNESFSIKIQGENRRKKITNEQQLFDLFPGFFVDDILET